MVTQRTPQQAEPRASRSNQPLREITAACDMLAQSGLTAAVLTTPSTAGDDALIDFALRSAEASGLALTIEPRATALVLRLRRNNL
jgi:hypothetical protein